MEKGMKKKLLWVLTAMCAAVLMLTACPEEEKKSSDTGEVPKIDTEVSSLNDQTVDLGVQASLLSVVVEMTENSNNYTYQWFSNSANSNRNGTAIPSETNPTFRPPTSTPGESFYYVEITFDNKGKPKTVASSVVKITVVDVPIIATSTSQLSDAVYLMGETAADLVVEVVNSPNSASYTYQWYSNTANSNSGGTIITTATTNTFTPPVTATGTVYYYVVVSFGEKKATSRAVKIEVTVEVPAINENESQLENEQPVKDSTARTLVVVPVTTANSSTYTYQWFSNTTNTNTGGTPLNPAVTTNSFIPPTDAAGKFYYYAEVSFGGSTIKSKPVYIWVIGTAADKLVWEWTAGDPIPGYKLDEDTGKIVAVNTNTRSGIVNGKQFIRNNATGVSQDADGNISIISSRFLIGRSEWGTEGSNTGPAPYFIHQPGDLDLRQKFRITITYVRGGYNTSNTRMFVYLNNNATTSVNGGPLLITDGAVQLGLIGGDPTAEFDVADNIILRRAAYKGSTSADNLDGGETGATITTTVDTSKIIFRNTTVAADNLAAGYDLDGVLETSFLQFRSENGASRWLISYILIEYL